MTSRQGPFQRRVLRLASHVRPVPVDAARDDRAPLRERVDAVIVGSGFSGMYLKYKLREIGVTEVRTYEKGGDVGGTWYWNRYPGAACDIESYQYSYSFSSDLEQEWSWSRRYGQQPEILEYAKFTASKFDLRQNVCFWTEVTNATYDELERVWVVRTDRGDCTEAKFLFVANGPLSAPAFPNISGMDNFKGESFHTHDWNHDIDMSGKRVGVIGTGSTATQCIPELAKVAKHLTVFQRTPAYCVQRKDSLTDKEEEKQIKANYQAYRLGQLIATRGSEGGNAGLSQLEQVAALKKTVRDMGGIGVAYTYGREGEQNEGESYAFGPLNNPDANMDLQEHLRGTIAEVVADPQVARSLMPRYPVACKRLCVTDDYWPTFNRDNVTLVDLGGRSISEVTAAGPVGPDGTQFEVDVLVYATGFDAMTGALGDMEIRGRGGQTLAEKWSGGVSTYLGMLTHGFPNMFIMVGPQSASVLANMIQAIEHQGNWFCRLVRAMRERGLSEVDADAAAEQEWVRHCSEVTSKTIWGNVGGGCQSWYNKGNLEPRAPGAPGGGQSRPGAIAEYQHVLPYTGGYNEYHREVRERGNIAPNLSPPPKGLVFA